MTQRLLTLALLLTSFSLMAQDVIWTEDFAQGTNGWAVNTILCGSNGGTYGNNSGTDFGIWELSSISIDGEVGEIPENTVFEWSFLNDTEYSITFYDSEDAEEDYGYVYGTYSLDTETGVMTSSVNAAEVIADGTAFSETTVGGVVEWATNMNVDALELPLVLNLIGTGDPVVELTNGGNDLTYTSADGTIIAEYSKRSECGAIWTWSPNGNLGNGVFGFEPPGGVFVNSETRTNGTMVMNNIFQMFRGDGGLVPSPNPPPYPAYVSELISPAIDVSAADRALSFSVTQFVAYLNDPAEAPDGLLTSFSISTDDGMTWSPAVDINPNFPTNTFRDNRQTIPIPDVFVGGADEIRIKLTFATDYYFWGVDDLSIQERIGYDVQANQNFFAIPDNANTPWSQLHPYFFLADIQNNGGLEAENVELNLTIVNETDGGTVVFDETKEYGNLAVDSLAENDFFDGTLDLPADPSSVGFYSGTYVISQDSADVVPANDSLFFDFSVTDSLFAKETGRTRGIFLSAEPGWYIGNSYYVPNGENWFARYISFMVDNVSDVATQEVSVFLYESDGDVLDVNGDPIPDGRIGPDEYELIDGAFNSFEFDGSEDEVLITIPMSVNEEGIPLQSGKYYFAIVQFSGDAGNPDDRLAISASEEYDYSANNFITDSIGIEQYAGVVDLTLEAPNFFSGGFGGDVAPLVRLSIGNNPFIDGPAIVNTDNLLPDEYNVSVFPVPADKNFTMKVEFPEQLDVLARLYDKTGRIILTQEFDQLQDANFTYDVSTLPAGMYFLQLDTDAGTRIEKIVFHH